ncbi:MAG: glucosaminidase domain-containing protein [Proteobacteria bacterium]|nr:glucosaminidase domain-containing protein [Pseudomonadota bacterium]
MPNVLITGVGTNWKNNSQHTPVATKKELFYRLMLPLVTHANSMVRTRRERLREMKAVIADGGVLDADATLQLVNLSSFLQVPLGGDESESQILAAIDQLLYRLDELPAALVLGQAAYESGYGTSRFAALGNAFFGQWTYGGEGIRPEQQRTELGDHRIASFEWPFDSVRGYYINLSTHRAYEPLRKLRAEMREAGKPLDSMVLADGLISYSERGQEYIDTLKSMITVNRLAAADQAVFRDEPLRFIVGAQDEEDATRLRAEIEVLRGNGGLDQILKRMQLE